MDILQTITELSHEFGTSNYVRGGGGNTSCKNAETLWVKPSGTTLSGLQPELFVALDRKKLGELYNVETPAEPSAREVLVKDMMANAVLPGSKGRASVEAPLHDSLSATFVVHTHPFIVNGMTCGKGGKAKCKELFPTALWLDYIDPGYTLCMFVRDEIQKYAEANGHEPKMIFLKNHGVFISADTAEEIRNTYKTVIDTLQQYYSKKNITAELEIKPDPPVEIVEEVGQLLADSMSDDTVAVAACGMFNYPQGPITPDHIVYAKSYPFVGVVIPETIKQFQKKHGYEPKIAVSSDAVFGIGPTETKAALALELAQDGAIVAQLAEAFGGIDFMTDQAREFIENWEVESYRSKQI